MKYGKDFFFRGAFPPSKFVLKTKYNAAHVAQQHKKLWRDCHHQKKCIQKNVFRSSCGTTISFFCAGCKRAAECSSYSYPQRPYSTRARGSLFPSRRLCAIWAHWLQGGTPSPPGSSSQLIVAMQVVTLISSYTIIRRMNRICNS